MRKLFLSTLSCLLFMQIHAVMTITCPQNIIRDSNNKVVNYQVTVTGSCDGLNIVASHPSGSEFPIGTTDVVVTAMDKCGNIESGIFSVTIQGEPDKNAVTDLTKPDEAPSKGPTGNVAINGVVANVKTSGLVSPAGYVSAKDNNLGAWKKIVDVTMPNPSVNDFTLRFNSSNTAPISIRLIDVSGKQISVNTVIEKNSYTIPGTPLSKGIYFAEVLQGTNRQVIKLVKL